MGSLIQLAQRCAKHFKDDTAKTEEAGPGPCEIVRVTGIDGRTRLSTEFGEVPASLIRKGDKLRTRKGTFVTVLGVDSLRFDADFLHYHPESAPICIPEHAFAPNRPERDIYLAPDQVVGGGINASDTLLGRAAELGRTPRRTGMEDDSVVYYVLKLSEPAAVMCEKVWLKAG